ncbi:MAG: C10 family peptidase [Muribaculaceae bacterium]|nr:C10 family peptidase [Muribaculaceae bacterium]
MKTIKFAIILVLGALALTTTSQAATLTPQQAKNKAMAFMTQKKGSAAVRAMDRASWRPASESVNAGNDLVYAFNAKGGGYVIVAGDDRINDVLAYSFKGSIDATTIPAAMQTMLASYAEQIEYMQEHNLKFHKAPTHAPVQPLIQTHWGQEWPYSHLITDNCPTGCIATSMSQVMYYHKWPQDSTTRYITPKFKAVINPTAFDWDNMQLTYSSDGEYPESQVTSVAHLMKVAGESVDMVYQKEQSGSYSNLIRPALLGCFKYDKGMRYLLRDDYTIDQWDEKMYNELANNRPIIYNAMTSWGAGHSFVCHGYDGNGKYYINWGWDGDCDGYFVLSILDSEGTGTGGGGANNRWSIHQDAVIGIQPPVEGSTDPNPGFVQIAQQLLLSESNITRDANGNFPPMHLQTVYYKVYDATGTKPLLIDSQGEVVYQPNVYDDKVLNTIAPDYGCFNYMVPIPNNLPNGTYRWVIYYAHESIPGRLYPCEGNDNIYIQMVVNGDNITLQPFPVKDLELSNPQYTLDDGKVATITFDVKNNADEFNGSLYVVLDNDFKGSECVAIPAGETQQVEFRLKSDRRFDPTAPYRVYTDPMLMHRVWGEGAETDARFENFDLSATNIDMENKVVTSHIISGTISSVNVGDAPFNGTMGMKVVNPNNENEVYATYITPSHLSAPIGGTVSMNVMQQIPTNVNRVRIQLGYNDRLMNTFYTTIGDFDVVGGAVAVNVNGQTLTLPSSDKITMPEGYDAFYSIGSNVQEVVPNSNPNTVYYVDNPANVIGLDNNIVLDSEGRSFKDVNIYDGHNFFLIDNRMILEEGYLNYYRTFTEEEVNTWTNFWMVYDDFVSITDLTTGKDWSHLLFPYSVAGMLEPNIIVLSKNCSDPAQIPKFWNNISIFYFIYPSMVGHTFKFTVDKSWTEQFRWSDSRLSEWLTLAGKSWYQELNNVYEQQGNKFVLKQHVTVPPFRSYLRTSSSILAAPSATSTIHPYYEYQQEYILNLPTDPDPGTNTDIEEIAVTPVNVDPSWYTIDGRQLPNEPVAPGLYIHKGKKVIKR